MDPEVFERHFKALGDAIDGNDPDPARGDWIPMVRVFERVQESATWLLDNLEGVPTLVQDQHEAGHLRAHAIERSAAFAVLLYCCQRHREARALLERCAALTNHDESRSLYLAGAEDLTLYTRVVRARWLLNHDRKPEARKLAAGLHDAPAPIAKLARRIERAPTPADPPTMFTLNGFGTKLYFDSEHEDDGSVVRTRFFTALFVPIIPIDAWRVTDAPDDHYYVHGKLPLTLPMRIWKYTALVLLAGAIAWGGISSYLASPERALTHELEAVAEYEDSDPERALARYEKLADLYADTIEDNEDLLPISEHWVELATRDIPEPLTLADVAEVRMTIARFEGLPARFNTPALAEPFVAALVDWSDQLGHASTENANASLDLLVAAERRAPSDARVRDRLRATHMALAERLAEHWPIEAILQYASLGFDPEINDAIGALLRGLPESPTLFADIGHEIIAWTNAAPGNDWAVDRVARGLELARDPKRLELFERRDETELRAALASDPSDQGIALVLAQLLRGRGELDDAVALLETLGKPGELTHDAQYLLASLEFDRGQHERAASLLEQMLTNRQPAFDAARRAYDKALVELEGQLITRAEQGKAPTQFQSKLESKDAQVASAAFDTWFRDEMERSTKIPPLRDAYTRRADVVPIAILLGTVQLEQSRSATGDERQRLLDAAQTTFLSFQAEAAGMPDYHASLAQVYHRLGKAAEGDAEFQVLLDDPDLSIRLGAAHGYRELGRVERAREISEAIYEQAEGPLRQHVAHFRAVLAQTLDERETWLGRANQDDPFVRSNLLEVAGDRLRLGGEFEAADEKFAQAYEIAFAQVEHGASPNNAALILLARHACTGKLSHVDKAVTLLEDAVAQKPDDAIVMHNYASVLEFRTTLGLIDRVVPVAGLRIEGSEADSILRTLLRSSKRDELRVALRESPQHQRVLDTLGRLEALAPSMAGVYVMQHRWLSIAENDAGLTKLLERLRLVENLDTSDFARIDIDDLEGRSDEQRLQTLDANLAARAAVQADGKRTSDPAKALLAFLDGEDLSARARLRPTPAEALADVHAAVAAHQRALALWPEGISGRELADTRIVQAMLEIAAEDDTMAEVRREHGRKGSSVVLDILLEQGSPLIAKLAANPAFQQGVSARATWADDELSVYESLLARAVGDEALRERARASLRTDRIRAGMEIGELLFPFDASLVRWRAVLEAEAR